MEDMTKLHDIHGKLTDKKILGTITPEEEKELEDVREKLESHNKGLIYFYKDKIDAYRRIYGKIQSIRKEMAHIENLATFGEVVIDIDRDIVKFNNKELDNDDRKKIASELRSLVPELLYRFKKGIVLNENEKLVVTIPNQIIETDKIDTIKICDIEIKKRIFKNNYKNVILYYNIIDEEDTWYLMEGYRHLSLEEMHHVIDLIYKPENITFCLGIDLCTEKWL